MSEALSLEKKTAELSENPLVPLRVPKGPKRRNLVIVAGGDTSQHTRWIKDLPEAQRDWDLALTHYGREMPDMTDADLVVRQKGFKYDCVSRMLQTWPWLGDYDYIWLCDDDIQTSWSDIQHRFGLMREYQLDLAQPALSRTSSTDINMTVERPQYILRYTNFAEVMAPIFSRAALRLCAPTFSKSPTGHWLDWLWAAMLGDPRDKVAILDAAPIHHPRDYGRESSVAWKYVRSHKSALLRTVSDMIRPYGADLEHMNFQEYGYVLKDPIRENSTLKLRTPPEPQRLSPRLSPLLKQMQHHKVSEEWQHGPIWQPAKPWLGGPAQTYKIPALSADNWCLSLGLIFNINARSAASLSEEFANNLLFFGDDSHKTPFGIQLFLKDPARAQQCFTLTSSVRGRQNFCTSINLSGVPYNLDLHIGIQIYPQAGWICTWLNHRPAKDYWCEPFRWYDADTVHIGNERLTGFVRNAWISPFPVAEEAG